MKICQFATMTLCISTSSMFFLCCNNYDDNLHSIYSITILQLDYQLVASLLKGHCVVQFLLSVLSAAASVHGYHIQLLEYPVNYTCLAWYSQNSRRSLHGHSVKGQHYCWLHPSCNFVHLHDILRCGDATKFFYRVSVEILVFPLDHVSETLASNWAVLILFLCGMMLSVLKIMRYVATTLVLPYPALMCKENLWVNNLQ